MNRHGACPQDHSPLAKCSCDSVDVRGQSDDQCIIRKLERHDEGKPGLSPKEGAGIRGT